MVCMFEVMHYSRLMYWRVSKLGPLEHVIWILLIFFSKKRTIEQLNILTDINMLLMVEKLIRRICHAILRHAETEKKL